MGLIKCPECGKEISDLAQNCPNCGRPLQINVQTQQNVSAQGTMSGNQQAPFRQQPKKKGHGCLITVLVFVGFVSIATAAAMKGASKTGDRSGTSANRTGAVEADAVVNEEIGIGKEGKISDELALVVNEVSETDSVSAANGYLSYKPDSGKYAVINVTIRNTSKKSQNLLLNYFKLVDPDDAEYVPTIIAVADDKFITIDTVNPNLEVTGNLLFEIPKNLSLEDCRLKYSDYGLFNDIVYFNLK